MNARVILTVVTVIMTILGSTPPAAALQPIINWSLDTCGHPPAATAANVTAVFIPDDPVGIDDCPALCDKFVAACKGAVNASLACWKGAVKKFAALQTAVCNLQSGVAKAACQDALDADKLVAKVSYIDAGRENGHSYCETTALFSCTVSCN